MHDKKCPNRELQCNAYMVMWVNCEPYLGKLPWGPYSAQRLLRDAKSKENGQVGLLLGLSLQIWGGLNIRKVYLGKLPEGATTCTRAIM